MSILESLHVKNIALIDDVELELGKGLNILTGETGAGKSILIDSVNFALGKRMPKEIVRDEASYALCELVFYVDDADILACLDEMDIPMDEEHNVILQRKIVNGKNVCKCNGETVSAARMQEIAALLIDIHGQHEHQSLLYKKNHRIMLDKFCGDDMAQMSAKMAEVYDDYKKADEEYRNAVAQSDTKDNDMDYARFVIDEINGANLAEGEDEELENLYGKMNHARKITEALQSVREAVSEEGMGSGAQISRAVSGMKTAAGLDEGASELFNQICEIEGLLHDFARALEDYEESLVFMPEDFKRCEERLDEINRLKSKYGDSIEKIKEYAEKQEDKLSKLEDYECYLNSLKAQRDEKFDILKEIAQQISQARKSEAVVLEKDIVTALCDLNFLDAKFEIRITSDIEKITSVGCDDVEFMISTNPGEQLKPLTQVASGGELSRIMLALKAVLARRDSIGTLIFDEIDTGISGKTAQLVADKMAQIAGIHQVICVTHLPQIASHANVHFGISKSVEGTRTKTDVVKLNEEESVRELARMLSGDTITDVSIKNAMEMKERANGQR